MPTFLGVDDPYVTERLFAVAYGCAMRSSNGDAVAGLAQDVYDWVFSNGMPPTHILLRDYARGVIEIALHRHLAIDVDLKKVRPPYKSEWLEKSPAEDTLEAFHKIEEGAPRREHSRWHLYDSVMGFGDFARYIIGTNHHESKWSSQRLGEPNRPSRRAYRAFEYSLTARQEREWNSYLRLRQNITEFKKWDQEQRRKELQYPFTDEQFDEVLAVATEDLSAILGKKKNKVLNELVLPYLDHPNTDEDHFDMSVMQRWVFQRVMELGWTVDLFGEFDSSSTDGWESRHPRTARKPERIGKKYQWIAYHELLARLSDNYKFKGDVMSYELETKYDGPWQLNRRDIDPSSLLLKTQREVWGPHTNTWWFRPEFKEWTDSANHASWIKESVFPAFEDLVIVSDPADSSEWLCLEAYYVWQETAPPEEDRYENPRGQLMAWLNGYIAKADDTDKLFDWLKDRDVADRRLPESHDLLDVFEGELFWSAAYDYVNAERGGHNWISASKNGLPKAVILPGVSYLNEDAGFDCSIDDTIRIYLPSKHLVEKMDLSWNGDEGCYYDSNGRLSAFDPSVRENGPGALLVRRDSLEKYLKDNGYGILWVIRGRKCLIGGRMTPDAFEGILDISFVCRITNNKIEHVANTRFRG